MDAPELLSVLDSLGDGVAVLNVERRYVYLNPAAIKLIGPLHLESTPPGAFFNPDGLTQFEPTCMPLILGLEGESTCGVRVFARNPSIPEGRHLSLSGGPWVNRQGEIVGAVEVLSDVSELRKAEEEALRAHAFLDNIVDHVPAIIFVKDAKELRYERLNRTGEEFLGLSKEEVLGKNDLDFLPREQAEFFIARDRETLAGGAMLEIPEEPIDTPRGRRWLSTRKVPIFNARGAPEYLLGISVDITACKAAEDELKAAQEVLERRVAERTEQLQKEMADRKLAQEALRRSEEQLIQSQKLEAVGRLAGGIAHDFNNMLSAMLGYAGLLALSLPPDAEGQQDVKQIIQAGERAAALVRQLLAFSRKQVLQPVVLDVAQVVTGMTEMVRRLLGERVELTVEAEAGCRVLADETQIEQVVLNLAINARDAMPNGGHLKISVASVTFPGGGAPPLTLEPGRYVRLTLADDGVGMTEETRSRVFEPFFTTKPRGQGTGLGAATVFGVVKQSGGDVFVESALGKGTTFEIYLPRAGGRAEPGAPLSEVLGSALRTATVLLVEDEPLVRAVTARILRQAGLQVLEAGTPDDAMEQCRAFSGVIHLLLTDVVLPGVNGRELARQLSKLRPDVQVMFMSGYTDDAFSSEELLDAGAPFLAKPFSADDLVRKVDEVLLGVHPPKDQPPQ